ncbi:hypothetical protein SOX05_08450 [Pseudomonas putida]|nr:hypothetical protein [Pseudomonas putida]MDY4319290.1 hypothetical protein [Pseudomonas putida]MDY4352675.1 hypothetical protein [Pseudomonas putida]
MSLLKDRFAKIDVQSAKEFVEEKVKVVKDIPAPVAAPAPKKVSESEMRLAAISTLSNEIQDADIGAKSKGLQKANLFLSEKTELALKRAILIHEHTKSHVKEVVITQRAVEHTFLVGEALKSLAFSGDADAIKLLEKIKAAGIDDYRVYKRQ